MSSIFNITFVVDIFIKNLLVKITFLINVNLLIIIEIKLLSHLAYLNL